MLENKENIYLNRKDLEMFLNGVKLKVNKHAGIYKVYDDKNIFLGTGEIKENRLKRDVIL